MKLIQLNPKANNKESLLSAINSKERSLRGGRTSFYKDNKSKWKHIKHNGWVIVSKAPGDIVFAKVQSRSAADESRIFEAFVGYLTRHFGSLIDSMTIYYR